MNEKTQLKPSFLVVDDEPAVGRLLKRALAPLTDDIVVVESAAEALTVCLGRSFDLVISDMRMPEMDGAELLSVGVAGLRRRRREHRLRGRCLRLRIR